MRRIFSSTDLGSELLEGASYSRACTINKYGSYLLIRAWAGLKWHPVLKV